MFCAVSILKKMQKFFIQAKYHATGEKNGREKRPMSTICMSTKKA